jgi:acyl-CoA thioesterase-1
MRKMLVWLLFVFFAQSAAAASVKVAVLGDSLVQGYGLPQGQGLVPQLQAWLDDQGAEVLLINAGVSGDTTAGGAARVDWTLADGPRGMIVLLGGNDLLRGLRPDQTRANMTSIVEAAQNAGVQVMLIGMRAPGNYGPAFQQEFDAIYGDLAADYGLVLHDFAFAGMLAAAGDDPVAARRYMQDDGIHPNAEGVSLNVAAMGPTVLQFLEKIGKLPAASN